MPDPLEFLYENELTYIRQLGTEFARKRPKIAERLLLDRETGASEDPHVERLIEAFAFLTARVRLKLEDEFPEITESFLEALYPHYLAPIPSMSIVEFEVDPQRANLPEGHLIERGSPLVSREVQGVQCRYRTTAPVTLWPLEVAAARYQTAPFGKDIIPPRKSEQSKAMLRLELSAGGGSSLAQLELGFLRFFLAGDFPLVTKLYELIFNHATEVVIRAGNTPTSPQPIVLPAASCLKQVGFERDEGMLPYGNRSFVGYRLLTEYFSFPSKFLFFDVSGLEPVRRNGFHDRVEILIFLNRSQPNLEPQVNNTTFRLGCAPIVNLFEQGADPIQISRAQTEYQVVPDVRHHSVMEVYSVDSVQSTNTETQVTTEYRPFYSFKHGAEASGNTTYWYPSRRPSLRAGDDGTEVFLSLVDLEFNPTLPPAEVLMLDVTCTNRDLPGQLRALGDEWGFQLLSQAPCRRIVPVVLPTAPARMPQEQLRWRLISHLALNHLSITGGEDGADALREILTIYDYAATRVTQQHIEGIAGVTSRRVAAPITDGTAQGFCRGVEVTLAFDEDKYVGSGPFLFACVLERFLGLYASINSATRMVARSKQREGPWKRWPFRSADRTLV